MKKIHVVTFAYEETGLGRVAETFGMADDRFVSLATDLVNRMVGSAKGVSVENPGSISAMVMDFVEDLEAEERGPLLAAAACGFFAMHYQAQVAQKAATETMRRFFDSMGGAPGEIRP